MHHRFFQMSQFQRFKDCLEYLYPQIVPHVTVTADMLFCSCSSILQRFLAGCRLSFKLQREEKSAVLEKES